MSGTTDCGALSRRISQVERNEFGLIGSAKNRAREKSSQQNPRATEGHSGRQRESAHDDAQDNDVHQQVRNIVLLVEISILIPSDAGVVVHGAEKRLGVALRKRSGCDRNDGPGALIKEWADVFNGGNSSLGWRGMMSGN